jgi:hypothetical protein
MASGIFRVQAVDNIAKNHWYPNVKFLVYYVAYYKKQIDLRKKDPG